jgi:class 3 adenylate cyclase/tetratricopeptide (TPR) repeat protein
MAGCPSCGSENAGDARFCSACGTALVGIEPAREQRKVVTVLFCDLVGSTALGESTDPEALRARMRRYFEDLRAILERHGGEIEKFVGDAVMAVFGIPVSHEDDALRAVRAADEMRAVVAEHGLEARIGINTGEVVVGGDGETLVTGDAVNVAARLEQAAPSGEILIGAETRLLVRDAIVAEAFAPLALKGKSEPVEAFRLLEVSGQAALARHLETPLVGRERERQRLWRDYEDSVADSTCRLFTLLGPAGIGKSRLVADFLERVGDSADVLRGRCLSYGEGITYWPLVEMLVAIGVEPDDVIGTSPAETQLAFRRLLEARAAERPQVVVLDDLQWAEPVFSDLVEHVADFSRDAPIFLLCVARTELLDVRPGWGGGKMNATALLLEPLDDAECRELMDRLVADAALDEELRAKIAQAAAGNPLYVEEMLAMVREHGGGTDIAVPPTITALLQARIDSLDGDVRTVMERGAVEGEVFHRSAVSVLAPDRVRPSVEDHLATLVRKELIRTTAATFSDDEGYRFRHLLIRDAAYESLPKATRAELHERFADWLVRHDLAERDEIVGYHLEQAFRYRAELDPSDARLEALGGRAAKHLAAAGTAADHRGDSAASRALFARARDLLPVDDERRAAIAVELTHVLQETNEVDEALAAAAEAMTSSDSVIRARGALAEAGIREVTGGVPRPELRKRREESRAVFEAAGDDTGLAEYWLQVGYDRWAACRAAQALEAWEEGLRHATAAGGPTLIRTLQSRILGCLVLGPIPVDEAVARVEALMRESRGAPLLEAWAIMDLGSLRAMEGRIDEARELMLAGWRTIRDAGHLVSAAGSAQRFHFIERRAGGLDLEQADRERGARGVRGSPAPRRSVVPADGRARSRLLPRAPRPPRRGAYVLGARARAVAPERHRQLCLPRRDRGPHARRGGKDRGGRAAGAPRACLCRDDRLLRDPRHASSRAARRGPRPGGERGRGCFRRRGGDRHPRGERGCRGGRGASRAARLRPRVGLVITVAERC